MKLWSILNEYQTSINPWKSTFMVFKVLYDAERLSYSQIFIILLWNGSLYWLLSWGEDFIIGLVIALIGKIGRVGKARESGSVLMWIRTFFMMPKDKTIPWPVPQEYDFGFSDWLPVLRRSEREIQDILSSLRERAGSQESNLSQGYRSHISYPVDIHERPSPLFEFANILKSETFDVKNQNKSLKDQIMSSVEHLKREL